MSNWKPEYSFLTADEEVIHALQTSRTDFVVTNQRFVIQREGQIHEDFDLKYIAHMYASTRDYKMWGAALVGIGIAVMALFPYVIVIGGLIAAAGVLLFLYKQSKIILNLSGVAKEFKYEVNASKEHIQRLVSQVSEARNKLSN